MKNSKLLATLALAFATFAVANPAAGFTGDIVEIRAVDSAEMKFGGRSTDPDVLCSPDHPLAVGDELTLRVRMLVENYADVIGSGGTIEPKRWYFHAVDSVSAERPKLGLWIGSRAAYAEYDDDKSGTVDGYKYYTDLYFTYKVQPGDLGLPVLLLNSTQDGPAGADLGSGDYFLLNCPDLWRLQNENGTAAKVRTMPQGEFLETTVNDGVEWPTADGASPNWSGNLESEGAYVKTIDFDGDDTAAGDAWRNVWAGTDEAPGVPPRFRVGGGTSSTATKVYVWSSDPTVVSLVASGDNTLEIIDGVTVLRVTVPAGKELVTFSMKGADSASAGETATLYMSPVASGNVTKTPAELAKVALKRTVKVVAPDAPTVRMFIREMDSTDETKHDAWAEADPDFKNAKVELTFKVSPVCHDNITLNLSAMLANGGGSLSSLYEGNFIRICDAESGVESYVLAGKPLQVSIGAGTSTVRKYVYVLGASEDTEDGIEFDVEKASGPADVVVADDQQCNLYISRAGTMAHDFSVTSISPVEGNTLYVDSGKKTTFTLKIDDTYKSLHNTDTTSPYILHVYNDELDPLFYNADSTEKTWEVTAPTKKGSDWRLQWQLTFDNDHKGTIFLWMETPDEVTQSRNVKYTIVINATKQVAISPAEGEGLFVSEGESYRMALDLKGSTDIGSEKYYLLKGMTSADDDLLTAIEKTTGAPVGPTAPFSHVATATFLDNKPNNAIVNVEAFLSDTQNAPGGPTAGWTKGTIQVTVTNVPPRFATMQFSGETFGPEADGGTWEGDPIYQGATKEFQVELDDVAADFATNDVEMVKMSIDGTYYYITNRPTSGPFAGMSVNDQKISHKFTKVKAGAKVSIWLRDKDMGTFENPVYPSAPNFTYSIPVTSRPGISIATGATDYGEDEANAANAYVTVTLDETASEELVVRFTVSKTTDGGFLRLNTSAGSVTNVFDAAGKLLEGEYDIIFPADTRSRKVKIVEMDGTDDTEAGLELNAWVATGGDSGHGLPWSGFYNKAQPQTVYVRNVLPELTSVKFSGRIAVPNATNTVPLGVTRTFSLNATDVVPDLTNGQFAVKWNIGDREYEKFGLPTNAENIVEHLFNDLDLQTVEVRVKDKDMADYPMEPNFRFYVNVVPNPYVEIRLGVEDGSFPETVGRDSYMVLALSEASGVDSTIVQVKVAKASDGGFLSLNTDYDYIAKAAETQSEVVYDVVFGRNTKERKLYIVEMDGTKVSIAGLVVNASVTNEAVNSYGVPLKDFYVEAEQQSAYVSNVDPVAYTSPSDGSVVSNTPAYSDRTIYYSVSDVKSDLDAGITVKVYRDGIPVQTTTVNDEDPHTLTIEGFPGDDNPEHIVVMEFTDKDGGSARSEFRYYVVPEKNVVLKACGPYVGLSSSWSDYHYTRQNGASGLGDGRVYAEAEGAKLHKVHDFAHYLSSPGLSLFAFAYGYKYGDGPDDGSLGTNPGHDTPIDKYGEYPVVAANYDYDQDSGNGVKHYDSFLYVLLNVTPKGPADRVFMIGEDGSSYPLPLPDTQENALSYPVQYWDAVFSLEWLTADNCGDINQDGIPDIVVKRFGMGVFGDDNDVSATADGEGDLKSVATYNSDKDKDGNDAPDFLPSANTAIYGSLIPGLSGTWVTEGIKFDALTEIRGYDKGLNDAMEQLGFSVESDRIYAEQDNDGKWQWTENCTISKLEWYAWREYAAANGLDWTDKDAWKQWSPERPTSPILNDTDGDGFEDGYEYYFWYRAHVGYMDGDVHKRLTGRRYDPRNPGEGVFISSEEIALLMDPRSDLSPVDFPENVLSSGGAATRDTDNDALPDLLEFMIGTNPFDFDTDGDGLPDGWELMLAGLNPLLAVTATDALNDGTRNYDGDAMAITSFALEKLLTPAPAHPEKCQFTTFAVIDPDGDSDGVQWYAATNTAECVSNLLEKVDLLEEEGSKLWTFTLADGSKKKVVSTVEPVVIDGGLAVSLPRDVAYLVEASEKEGEGDDAVDILTRGWPVRLPAGTKVSGVKALTSPNKVYMLKLTENIPNIAASAAWIYGRGSADATRGAVAKTAADYGCLALARPLAVPKDRIFCAPPKEDRDVALLHYLVYQQCGFDPRTAWCARDPIAARWGSTVEGESGENEIVAGANVTYLEIPARTREYRTYDEFLVYSFFLNNGCDMYGYPIDTYSSAPYLAQQWGAFTTNPQGPDEPTRRQLEPSDGEVSAVGWNQYFFGTESTNGADTDNDGVPDGWELYVMAGPKTSAGKFVFAPAYSGFRPAVASADMEYSYFSPFRAYAKATETLNVNYVGVYAYDELNEFQEFEGTDSTAWYADVQSPATTPYSTTIVHAGEWTWFNKFFPTDPWNRDTDGDGIEDNLEGERFAYGTPADDGMLKCIPGGGLNPCSVDTDFDGLPDKWEFQFKGETQFPGIAENGTLLPDVIASLGNKATDADGNEIGNYLQGLIDGMDGTAYDAQNSPLICGTTSNGISFVTLHWPDVSHVVNQVVDRDYDHDGLENWQEYFTGMMRCWRYDDPVSPWIPIPSEAYQTSDVADYAVLKEWYEANKAMHPNIDELVGWDVRPLPGGDESQEEIDDFWYSTLVDRSSFLYNPGLVTDVGSCAQYLSFITNTWDAVYGGHYWFYDRVGDSKISDIWAYGGTKGAPTRYACCSPINPDSDLDGMDDYYELFHGMNPLLGASGILKDTGLPCDLVFDSWGKSFAYNADHCYWTAGDNRSPGSDFDYYDFVRNPWMNGSIDADPDGDGIPNQTEAMLPKLASPQLHTDPTPLWMTDSSYEYSIVRMFYRMPYRFYDAANPAPFLDYLSARAKDDNGNETTEVVNGEVVLAYKETFKHEFETLVPQRKWTETYWYKDFEGYHEGIIPVVNQRYGWYGTYNPDSWGVATDPAPDTHYWNWMFSFEENEGYDSDHDALSDEEEKAGRFRGATDPLYADSPHRRQAMYFQGPERPSALQTPPQDKENYPVCTVSYQSDMTFRTFTVECWVKPDSIDDSVLVERVVFIGRESPGDEERIRKNFQLAIKNGLWFAKFDPFSTRADDSVEVLSVTKATTDGWTHLAATYDGNELVLYVNGVAEKSKRSGLLPAYGSQGVAIHPDQSYMIDMEYSYRAIIVGASAKTQNEGGTPYALDVTLGIGWDSYARFYKGWIDEVRVWDGARTADEIAAAMSTRFDAAMAAENRQTFFEQWSTGKRRDDKDANGNATEMPAELIYHWSFDSVPGAQNESAVAKSPLGFHDARAVLSRPDGYVVSWWQDVLDGLPPDETFTEGTPGYAGAVYDDKAWVPWIPSTVAHLPRFDGTTLDSFFWSKDFMGDAAGSYSFVNSAEPVSRWRQFTYNGAQNRLYYWTTPERHFLVNSVDAANGSNFRSYFEFTGRNRDNCGDDLIPLGGAYVRMTDNTVGLWDGQGASSNWEITGSDADGDGLPDWWERYADENYRPAGMDPSVKIGWDTKIVRDGIEMIAGEAYLRDLAMGVHMGADGEISLDENGDYRQVADEDGSGVPDWWEDMFNISGELGIDDHDNDGLPNYVEYLLSEVFKFEVVFDPTIPNSVDVNTPDYFYRVGDLYVGEIFTDHDLMEDAWEDDYPTLDDGVTKYASRFAYDTATDADEDGWSNISEVRYSNMAMPIQANAQTHYSVTDGLVADYPIPTIALTVRYNGGRQNAVSTAPLFVRVRRRGNGNRDPDAEYLIGEISEGPAGTGADSDKETAEEHSYARTLGKWSDRHVRGTLTPGNVSLDSLALQSCYDPSAMIYTWIVFYNSAVTGSGVLRRGSRSEYDLDRLKYGELNVELLSSQTSYYELEGIEKRTDETGATAVWTIGATGAQLGTVNLRTGEFDLDFGTLKGLMIQDKASTNTSDKVSAEEQTYRIVYDSRPSVGLPRHLYLGIADRGYVREGLNDIEVFADIDGNGEYNIGEPYGVATDVNVTWKDVPVDIEITEDSPVTQRFDLWGAKAMLMGNTNVAVGVDTELPTDPVRVRVVRWKIDDLPRYELAVQPEVVFDQILDPSVAKMFTEADFVGNGKFDIDWDNFYSGVAQQRVVQGRNLLVVKADYLVVFGDGPIGGDEALDVSWLNSSDTNRTLTVSKQVITRRYGETRVLPVPVSPATVAPESSANAIVATASPTFAWTLNCPELEGYTAFRIQVTGSGVGTVYDSGIRRAPARDVNGVYRWTAPLYVDDITASGKVFANKANYSWKVSMYNAKFKDDAFSSAASFLLHVQNNGYSSGTVKAAVRYFGPEKSYDGKVVRVQAFLSPDFGDMPVAAGYVTDKTGLAAVGGVPEANCSIVGVPAGTYYLLAFIDSNGNGVRDTWESAGWFCKAYGGSSGSFDPVAVTVGPDSGLSDTATIYIEDADTDNDGLPDSWEYAQYGRLTAKGVELLDETPAGEFLVNKDLVGALTLRDNAREGAASLATHVRSVMRNAGTLALAAGADTTGYDTFADAISGFVSEELADDGVTISSLEIVDGKVVIKVDTETEGGASSPLLASHGPTVVAKVYWKQSLDDEWTLIKTSEPFTAGGDAAEISIDKPDNASSGFYQVVVEPTR